VLGVSLYSLQPLSLNVFLKIKAPCHKGAFCINFKSTPPSLNGCVTLPNLAEIS
jgi:hypothetical protein